MLKSQLAIPNPIVKGKPRERPISFKSATTRVPGWIWSRCREHYLSRILLSNHKQYRILRRFGANLGFLLAYPSIQPESQGISCPD
ncbi:hypothetical protein BDV30DRAFT_209695 [Aspergillus minisclerotigenes]|uniref:Uncharacterized protein n=1 Tax=Aspergillus minisclerotigenes TaxID=656917 RepID=A0A5N6J7S9_9EURO|nr:hypothetical protein BDV30DRAFT_209695 [Aspergillus minisclerotigenes]